MFCIIQSRHDCRIRVYILMCSLMHLLLGAYAAPRKGRLGRGVQYVASAALTAALGMFVYGFWIETPLAQIDRPLTRVAIDLALAGTLLHCIAAVFRSVSTQLGEATR